MADQSHKTEQPTPQRLRKARQEGQFPVSKEFPAALQFLVFAGLFSLFAASYAGALAEECRRALSAAFRSASAWTLVEVLTMRAAREIGLPLLAAGLVLTVTTLGGHFFVTGFGISGKKLSPDLSRLNPLQKLRQMPRQNGFQFVQALVLLPVFCYCLYVVVRDNYETVLRLPYESPRTGITQFASALSALFWKVGALFLLFGAVDFVRERRHYLRQMRMSRQEIREEFKETEGNPETKLRLRRLRRDLLQRKMMAEVPKATAVVVNPTHYAVALRYRMESMAAPQVVAKGKNYLALRIRAIAQEHEVPIVENALLAQALYKSTEVGQEIPPHLYRAVAEILAYIYRVLGGRLPG